MLGMRRIVKNDFRKEAAYPVPPSLTGGLFLYGKIGGGKTTGMFSIAQKYHDHPERKYKVIHLWGGDRMEQLYWTLMSQDIKYWNAVKTKLKLNEDGPKQYRVNLLYPHTNKLPHKLPELQGFVHSKVFQIPIKEITNDDLALVLDNVSESGIYLWRSALEELRDKDGAPELEKLFKDLEGTNSLLYKNFINPLCKNKTLCSYKSQFILDLQEELKDRDAITVLCLDFVEKEQRLFIMGWILRQISELLDSGKIRGKNIIMMNEAAEFFRATDDAIVPTRYKVFRRNLSHYIRMGRRGMHMFLDAQSPHETKGLVDGSQDFTILGRMLSESDIVDATSQLLKFNLIKKLQIKSLATLEPGEYVICESGKMAKMAYFFLPRTDYWRPGNGSFYRLWQRLHDKWLDIKQIQNDIENEYKIARDKILENEKLAKLLEKVETENKPKKRGRKPREEVIEEEEVEEPEEEEFIEQAPRVLAPTPVVEAVQTNNEEEEMFQSW